MTSFEDESAPRETLEGEEAVRAIRRIREFVRAWALLALFSGLWMLVSPVVALEFLSFMTESRVTFDPLGFVPHFVLALVGLAAAYHLSWFQFSTDAHPRTLGRVKWELLLALSLAPIVGKAVGTVFEFLWFVIQWTLFDTLPHYYPCRVMVSPLVFQASAFAALPCLAALLRLAFRDDIESFLWSQLRYREPLEVPPDV